MMWLLIFSLIAGASAEICDVGKDAHENIFGRNLTLELPGKNNTLTLVGSKDMGNEQRAAMAKLFYDESAAGDALVLKDVDRYVESAMDIIRQSAANIEFLKSRIQTNPPTFVAIEADPATFKQWQQTATDLYLSEFTKTLRQPREVLISWRKLLLALVPAPLFLNLYEPHLFQSTRVIGIDLSPPAARGKLDPPNAQEEATAIPPERPTAENAQQEEEQETKESETQVDRLREQADAATARMERSLADNPRTRSAFRRFKQQIQPGSSYLRRNSDAEIRRQVMDRTWRQGRGEMGVWLRAQLAWARAAGGKSEGTAKSHRTRQREQQARTEQTRRKAQAQASNNNPTVPDPIYRQILEQKGSGIFFVVDDHLQPLMQHLAQACRKEAGLPTPKQP
ncbi:MAG: hypothetical protein KF799_08260 [Bdellovibrionales bacterium]|nr:hypothetical protein [Bdellovibrionales bacterium]